MKTIDFKQVRDEKALTKLCVAGIDAAMDMHRATGFAIGICFFITMEVAKRRAMTADEGPKTDHGPARESRPGLFYSSYPNMTCGPSPTSRCSIRRFTPTRKPCFSASSARRSI